MIRRIGRWQCDLEWRRVQGGVLGCDRTAQLLVEYVAEGDWKWSAAWVSADLRTGDPFATGKSATQKQARSAAMAATRRRLSKP